MEKYKTILVDKGIKKYYTLPKNSFSFRFLGRTLVIYHNPRRIDTYSGRFKIRAMKITYSKGKPVVINSSKVASPHSQRVRQGQAEVIDVFIK